MGYTDSSQQIKIFRGGIIKKIILFIAGTLTLFLGISYYFLPYYGSVSIGKIINVEQYYNLDNNNFDYAYKVSYIFPTTNGKFQKGSFIYDNANQITLKVDLSCDIYYLKSMPFINVCILQKNSKVSASLAILIGILLLIMCVKRK